MRSARLVLAVAGAAMLLLSACGPGKTPQLMNVRSATNGPDEFSILPPLALELPEDLAALPEPTPGGENLTDPRPFDDAIVALGGKPSAVAGLPAPAERDVAWTRGRSQSETLAACASSTRAT